MTLDELNIQLSTLATHPSRETALQTARWLVQFMGLRFADTDKEKGILPNKQELKKYLVRNTLTNQGLLFRFTEKQEPVKIILGVLKKIRKDQITQLIDKENLICFQKDPPFIQGRPSANAYLIYFVTTESFDRLYVVLFNDNQKRIISLRNKLTPTQFNKILPQWENIGQKSKPEIAAQLWKSLDLKEVNKEFYKQIKEQFDALVEMAVGQDPKADEKDIKQFAVRLIGRYIFCWFLKEKGIIPNDLLESGIVKGSEDYLKNVLQPLFFKTLNTPVPERDFLKSADPVLQKLEAIPYLNGGLFDRHPEDKLFPELKLNDWLYSFVQVLENFDFTVDESSSQYQLVSIDPEMLGRIFENLLASQNEETEKLANQRKAYGAFYTPREIVDYMVNESLKAHLETHLLPADPKAESSNKAEEPAVAYKGTLFQQLEPQQILIPFGNKEKMEAADRERIRKNLQTKIDKLFAAGCTDNPFDKDETPAVRKLLSEITALDPACGSGAFPMGMMLRLMELRQIVGHGHRNNYDLKSEILSRNIYGVDIMSMAVEIARLRAWLSLVLEAEYKPQDKKNNFGIAALPNLDFKFICANSLIDSGYDAFLEKVRFNATLYRMDGEIQKLERLREEYYDPKGDKTKKKDLQNEFYKTKTYIKTEFDGLKKAWKLEDFLSKVDDWDPFDDSKPSSFFSPAWMFGIREGFDVVIGNPPYVNISNLKPDNYRKLLKSVFYSAKNKTDLYAFFIEAYISRLKEKGNLIFIVPHTWKATDSFSKLRELIFKQTKVNTIVNLNMGVFEAIVKPLIIHLSKTINKNYSINILNDGFNKIGNINIQEILRSSTLAIDTTSTDKEKSIFEKIEYNCIPLEKFIRFSRGIKTSDDKRFIKKAQVNNDCKPVFRGKNIKAYKLNWNNEYVWYRPDLMKEKVGSVSHTKEFFEVKEKIVTQRVNSSSQLLVAYDTNQSYFLDTVNVSRYESWDKQTSLKFICGVLNSKLINFWYCNKYKMPTIGIYELHSIPIKKIELQEQFKIEKIVDEIIEVKNEKRDTASLEKEIDVLVYKLYNLTYEEVKVVDKDFWMGEEEYKNFKVQ